MEPVCSTYCVADGTMKSVGHFFAASLCNFALVPNFRCEWVYNFIISGPNEVYKKLPDYGSLYMTYTLIHFFYNITVDSQVMPPVMFRTVDSQVTLPVMAAIVYSAVMPPVMSITVNSLVMPLAMSITVDSQFMPPITPVTVDSLFMPPVMSIADDSKVIPLVMLIRKHSKELPSLDMISNVDLWKENIIFDWVLVLVWRFCFKWDAVVYRKAKEDLALNKSVLCLLGSMCFCRLS